jgi:hypothetical protein
MNIQSIEIHGFDDQYQDASARRIHLQAFSALKSLAVVSTDRTATA